MAKTRGYRSPGISAPFFLKDWYDQEIGQFMLEFEEELREDLPEDEVFAVEYTFAGPEMETVNSAQELAERVFSTDVAVGRAEYEFTTGSGKVWYETALPMEGDGKFKAEFGLENGESAEAVRENVHEYFDSFLGMNLPGKHPRQYVEKYFD